MFYLRSWNSLKQGLCATLPLSLWRFQHVFFSCHEWSGCLWPFKINSSAPPYARIADLCPNSILDHHSSNELKVHYDIPRELRNLTCWIELLELDWNEMNSLVSLPPGPIKNVSWQYSSNSCSHFAWNSHAQLSLNLNLLKFFLRVVKSFPSLGQFKADDIWWEQEHITPEPLSVLINDNSVVTPSAIFRIILLRKDFCVQCTSANKWEFVATTFHRSSSYSTFLSSIISWFYFKSETRMTSSPRARDRWFLRQK